jgi:hypothetical protein
MPDDDLLDPSVLDAPDDEAEGQAEEIEANEQGQDDNGEEGQRQRQRSRDGDGQQVSQPRRSRENEAVRSARERAQAAEARLEALERIVRERQQEPDPAQLARQQAEEAERIAMMLPHEAAQYTANKVQQQMERRLLSIQQQQADALDQIKFQGLTARDPRAAKFADDVERVVREQAAQGWIVPRERALAFVIGEAVLKQGAAAAKKQRTEAAGRVAANTVTRGSAGGDVAADRGAGRGNSLADLEKRLRGKFI